MKIIINSYIKEKVKIELWQCSQNILSIDLTEGEDCVTDIDLPEYGKTEILVAVSYEEPEEAGNFLDHFLWGLYYLLDGDIGSPLDGESGLIGTKISGEFREDTALKLSCVGSSPSKGYVVTIECKENLEKLMMNTSMLSKDLGTVLVGEDAVTAGLVNEVGGIDKAYQKLRGLMSY